MKYSQFAHRVDIDALEAAIGFEPIDQVRGEDRGHCPLPWGLHKNGDTTGKFSINREKRCYNCFVCGGGNLLSLVMATEDLDPEAATKFLYGLTKAEDAGSEALDEIDRRYGGRSNRREVPYFNQRVLDKWDQPHRWYDERGIHNNIRNFFGCGYDPEALRHKNGESYSGPAVVLPHFYEGKLVGWQNRWLDPDRPKWVPKYTNTPDFPREWTLWGYDACIEGVEDQKPIIVESVPTALRLWSLGHPAIATFGSNMSENQMVLLRGFLQGVVLAPDNDAPGTKWLAQLTDYLGDYIPLSVVGPVGEKGDDLGDIDEALVQEVLARPVLV